MSTLRFVLPQGERLRTRQVRVSVVLVPLSLVGYSMLSVLVFILVLVLVVFILVFVLVFVEVLVYVFLRLSVTPMVLPVSTLHHARRLQRALSQVFM